LAILYSILADDLIAISVRIVHLK